MAPACHTVKAETITESKMAGIMTTKTIYDMGEVMTHGTPI